MSPLYCPAPSAIAVALLRLTTRGVLLADTATTLLRLALGFVVGGSIGLGLGLAMSWSARLRRIGDPVVAAAHPIPKTAILPLILVVFGIGEPAIVAAAAIGACFPLLINTMTGVRQIDPIYLEVAANYGSRPLDVVLKIIVPASLPSILAGVRIAFNAALVVTIAIELVAAERGLGAMMWLARETLRTEDLYAGLIVVATLGIGFNALLRWVAGVLAPWHSRHAA